MPSTIGRTQSYLLLSLPLRPIETSSFFSPHSKVIASLISSNSSDFARSAAHFGASFSISTFTP